MVLSAYIFRLQLFMFLALLTPLTLSFPPGTSTDVSRYAGQYEHVFEATTAGVTLQAPQLDINTVAAGGGSRLFFRSVSESPVLTQLLILYVSV